MTYHFLKNFVFFSFCVFVLFTCISCHFSQTRQVSRGKYTVQLWNVFVLKTIFHRSRMISDSGWWILCRALCYSSLWDYDFIWALYRNLPKTNEHTWHVFPFLSWHDHGYRLSNHCHHYDIPTPPKRQMQQTDPAIPNKSQLLSRSAHPKKNNRSTQNED